MPDKIENLTQWLPSDKAMLGFFLQRSSSGLENGFTAACQPGDPGYRSPSEASTTPLPQNGSSNGHCTNGGNALNSVAGNGHGPAVANGKHKKNSIRSSSRKVSQESNGVHTPKVSEIVASTESSSSFSHLVILGAAVTMAAVGIASAQDWIGFLTIAGQLGLIAVIILAYVYRQWIVIAFKTLPRDIKGGYRYAKVLFHVGKAQRNNWTVPEIFTQNARKHPDKVCFYFEEEKWTFRQVDEMSNRVGNYFAKLGLTKGDSVSLFMENRPEYVCIWLGLCKIGVVPALINFNLRLGPLKHSITISKSKSVVYGSELTAAMREMIETGGMEGIPCYFSGSLPAGEKPLKDATDLDAELKMYGSSPPTPSEKLNFTDKLLYIYTSGTTGLPKAAVIKNSRFIFFSFGIHYFIGVSNNEIIYDPLPMYHTAGGMLGVGQAILFGATAVLRKKFSASAFWKDCAKYGCTAAQYIGEICRYLLSQPPSADDKAHTVKLMFGNGLRPQIWAAFAERFNIKIISEFYGATEGNCNIINIDNHVGAVGFISRLFPFIYPVTLIKVDEATGEPIRDPRTGLVMRCRPDEDGELVGKIVENHPVREFQGYADATATTKKIVRDVFRKGDAAFRTGDVLMMDQYGYFFFKDRTGDTFRWKGENCSTSEVEAVVSNVCGLKDAVVYGVEIPGSEGRAGMAAILDPEESLDMVAFASGVVKALPSYARPIFVRIIKHMDMTGTYKMKKLDLQQEGFDITKTSDRIYILQGSKYALVDNALYSKIVSGQMRL